MALQPLKLLFSTRRAPRRGVAPINEPGPPSSTIPLRDQDVSINPNKSMDEHYAPFGVERKVANLVSVSRRAGTS